MAKVLGGREHGCALCGGTTMKIKILDDIYYQCKECGALTKGYEEEEVIIYKEEEEYVTSI
ncbi:MAG: hypothetical protein ACI3T9_07255 [Romboutsia timonensis]